jgi:hypothetical protein
LIARFFSFAICRSSPTKFNACEQPAASPRPWIAGR